MDFNELYITLTRDELFFNFFTFSILDWIVVFSLIFGLAFIIYFFKMFTLKELLVIVAIVSVGLLFSMGISTYKAINYELSANEKEKLIQDYLSEKDNIVKVDINLYKIGDGFASGKLTDDQPFYLESDSIVYDIDTEQNEIPYYEYVPIDKDIKGKKEYNAGKYNEKIHLPKQEANK